MPPRRPRLKPALRRLWRDPGTLQLGLDPSRAVALTGLDPALAALVEKLDGTLDEPGLVAAAAALGLDAGDVADLLAALGRAGVLEDAAETLVDSQLTPTELDRLAPDVAAALLVRPTATSGWALLDQRRRASVLVCGAGRVGATLAALLAAAGVGAVAVDDAAAARPADLSPGGLGVGDLGGRRQEAAARIVRAAAGSVRTSIRSPDLVVLARDGGLPDTKHAERLVRSGVAHLYAAVQDVTGVVGPLVLPGRSSCGRCHDLHRADRDPAWPSLVAQVSTAARSEVRACDVALATAVAAIAGLQVLAVLDGADAPPAVDGTLEIAQADGRMRRRTWPPHPLCGCTWPGVAETGLSA